MAVSKPSKVSKESRQLENPFSSLLVDETGHSTKQTTLLMVAIGDKLTLLVYYSHDNRLHKLTSDDDDQ